MTFISRLMSTRAPAATLLIRVMVGAVFLSEGIQKFVDPAMRGAGRFAKIGICFPDLMGPFVGGIEIVCGTLILIGLMTRAAAIPLIVNMLVALLSTKIPILLGHGFWGFSLKPLPSYGLLSMAHEARTDFAMLLGSLFILITGSGPFALDPRVVRKIQS